jgi:hypothetical protein
MVSSFDFRFLIVVIADTSYTSVLTFKYYMGKVHEREVFKDSPKSFLFIYSLKPNRVNSISISPEKPKS